MARSMIEMSFCHPDWELLRKAIIDRGLQHLIAKTGESAEARNKNRTAANFEPLLSAHERILKYALELFGVRPGCPICTAEEEHKIHPCTDPDCIGPGAARKNWINGAADDALDYAKKHHLLNPTS